MNKIVEYPQQIKVPHQANNFIYCTTPFSAIQTFEMFLEIERNLKHSFVSYYSYSELFGNAKPNPRSMRCE